MQYGIMFEDINHSGDGGIYAELVRNRAFQGNSIFPSKISPWTAVGSAQLSLQNLSQPLSAALPTSLRVTASKGTAGIANPGFWGIDVKVQKYTGSFWVKGKYDGSFTASLQSTITNETYGSVKVRSQATDREWREHKYTLVPQKAGERTNNTLVITYDASATNGHLDFNLISLFPPTYKNRPNGMRIDIMEALKALNPKFLRMPGGNNLEGNDPPYYWKWNETLGPLKDRLGYPGTWSYENTNGLGLVEYLNWCTDLGMEPVLAVWAGFYLDGPAIPESALQPYIDDALNELEFIMGDVSTPYGAMRAKLGYPKPWTIKYVEVGNEDNLGGGGTTYNAYRFQAFYDAIKAKYPHMKVFASTTDFKFAETEDAGEDYHHYSRPDFFVGQFNYFDNFTTGQKIMIGEYATVQPNVPQGGDTDWAKGRLPFPTWIGTVGEAVFLLGAERNADKVWGSAYAPLLQNLDAYQWTPDLISFTADTDKTVLSTSYHMLQLFGSNPLSKTLPVINATFDPVYYVAGLSENRNSYVLKYAIYNTTSSSSSSSSTSVPMRTTFQGVRRGAKAQLTVLEGPGNDGNAAGLAFNDIGKDIVRKTVKTLTAGRDGMFEWVGGQWSVGVLEVER
ncbi:glycoside hydrolase [Delitschia confertaspora ATCC 74209]|uniref:non-reducing end alpha-L-arabinofuranosidase n=1 Tax=Delitschia confertaspora ATCC 74209 TaxID=1513339 RepID=A0A9P4JT20_9PLEO|nr:glycoside hydrolase [Delitschia confertaspora ATCC 74209]